MLHVSSKHRINAGRLLMVDYDLFYVNLLTLELDEVVNVYILLDI